MTCEECIELKNVGTYTNCIANDADAEDWPYCTYGRPLGGRGGWSAHGVQKLEYQHWQCN